jgi:cystathionine beta-lyase
VALGDTGYAAGTAYAEALAGFARTRWSWDGLAVERTAIVPDVMLGIVEMLKLVSGPGDPVIVNSPVYPPFYQFVGNMDRHVVEAELGADGRIDFEILEDVFHVVLREEQIDPDLLGTAEGMRTVLARAGGPA